jgi:diaminopimelate decarboxylase
MATVDTESLIRVDIGRVAVHELAKRYGTPLYVYDEAVIRQRIDDLRAFDRIRYAQKACSNIAILDLMRRQDVLVDAVSAGEIYRAQRAGYAVQGDPPPIVYTADVFDRESLRMCLDLGLHVNLGSPDMIDQYGEFAPGREITLRVNPGFGHGHSRKTNTGGEQSKHGIWHAQVDDCLLRADRYGLSVTGVHMHIGSGTDLEHLAQVCGAMEHVVRRAGRTVQTISAGGGLPIPYRAGEDRVDLQRYFAMWDAVRNRLASEFGHAVRLEIEPGRYLVAESGYLIAEIRAVKQMGENLFYLLDAGFNNLARPILYGAYHPMSVSPASGRRGSDRVHPVVVGGPLCESGDIFTQEEGGFVATRHLPAAAVGDYLVIECAGAYGFVMASNYNSKPLAAEVLVRDGQAHLIRARQPLEDLVRGEIIPQAECTD